MPTDQKKLEAYAVEQPFALQFKGVFVQLMVLLERLSATERIVRVDNFELKRMGSSLAPYVELNGKLEVKTYKYVGSKADDLGKTDKTEKPDKAPDKKPAPASAGGSS